MPLPQPSPLHVEIAPDADPGDSSTWSFVEVTGDRRESAPVAIAGGRRDQASRVAPTTCSTRFNNRNGTYSNRNPLSPYYGKLRQNTPLRVRWGDHLIQARLPGRGDSVLSTPDTSQIRVTGAAEVRFLAYLEPGLFGSSLIDYVPLGGRYLISGDERSWIARIMSDRLLRFTWSPDGTFAAVRELTADEPLPVGELIAGRIAVQMDDGSGNVRADFYTGDDLDGPWTPLGSEAVDAGTSSIHAGADELRIGWTTDVPAVGGHALHGVLRGFQLWDGIEGDGGSVAADPGLESQSPDATSWTGADGLPWQAEGAVYLDDANSRHVGFVAEWPTRWDQSGRDSWVPVKAPGPLRRLQRGRQKPLRSPLFRDTVAAGPVDYWPCEDGADSSRIAGGLPGTPPMRISGDVQTAEAEVFTGSDPLLVLNDGALRAAVRPYESDDDTAAVSCVMSVPSGGLTGGGLIARLITTGDAVTHEFRYVSGGEVEISIYDGDGALLDDNTTASLDLDGKRAAVAFGLRWNGTDVFAQVEVREIIDDETVASSISVTSASASSGVGRLVGFEFGGGLGGELAVGHIAAWPFRGLSSVVPAFAFSDPQPLLGNIRETAAARFVRLCMEEGVRVTLRGAAVDSQRMGLQRQATLLELLRECEAADVGSVMHEYAGGLALVTRADRYAQQAALALDVAAGQVSAPPEPTDDDDLLLNDFTAEREGGSSARVVDEQHRDRFGHYENSATVNVFRDHQLEGVAAWKVHLGTVDEYRWPVIALRLHHDPDLIDDWLAFRLGNRVTVASAWKQLPGIDIDVLVDGWSERLSLFRWDVALNCVPASPWRVPAVGDDDAIIDTDGSEVDSEFDAGTDTSLAVAVTRGGLWSTLASDYPVDVKAAGVVLRVTGVSGSSSPQTLTVQQAPVNGVEKTIPAGDDVRLADPSYIGL
ncbi:MAG: hypothetical protein ACODAF_08510 [Actinomycetota bacterium]